MRPIAASLIASAVLALFGTSTNAATVYKVHIPIPSLATTGSSGGETTEPEPKEPLTLTLQQAQLRDAVVGSAYSMDFSTLLGASGDGADTIQPTDVSWALGTGTIPPGLTLIGSELKGTPTKKTTSGSSFEVIATYQDAQGKQVYTLKGLCCINPPEVEPPQAPDGFTQQRPSGVCPEW
ncbi:putative Ig domain-containing protein [Comamonas sp. MYb69]|uniref:putative Ig domain-containing protein n=1 Tax=Comamonas sp. MYb69 TaxID=1848650 RepID=UPI0030D7DE98